MLEQDYLKDSSTYSFKDIRSKALNEYSSQLIKELIIPKLTKEVNLSKRYAPLRQVYYSLILSRWFKSRFKGLSPQGTVPSYISLIDKQDLTNLTSKTPWSKATYFNAYKKSFAQGEYNIKEPHYTPTGQVIRSYFSGGIAAQVIPVIGIGFREGSAGSGIVTRPQPLISDGTTLMQGNADNTLPEGLIVGAGEITYIPNEEENPESVASPAGQPKTASSAVGQRNLAVVVFSNEYGRYGTAMIYGYPLCYWFSQGKWSFTSMAMVLNGSTAEEIEEDFFKRFPRLEAFPIRIVKDGYNWLAVTMEEADIMKALHIYHNTDEQRGIADRIRLQQEEEKPAIILKTKSGQIVRIIPETLNNALHYLREWDPKKAVHKNSIKLDLSKTWIPNLKSLLKVIKTQKLEMYTKIINGEIGLLHNGQFISDLTTYRKLNEGDEITLVPPVVELEKPDPNRSVSRIYVGDGTGLKEFLEGPSVYPDRLTDDQKNIIDSIHGKIEVREILSRYLIDEDYNREKAVTNIVKLGYNKGLADGWVDRVDSAASPVKAGASLAVRQLAAWERYSSIDKIARRILWEWPIPVNQIKNIMQDYVKDLSNADIDLIYNKLMEIFSKSSGTVEDRINEFITESEDHLIALINSGKIKNTNAIKAWLAAKALLEAEYKVVEHLQSAKFKEINFSDDDFSKHFINLQDKGLIPTDLKKEEVRKYITRRQSYDFSFRLTKRLWDVIGGASSAVEAQRERASADYFLAKERWGAFTSDFYRKMDETGDPILGGLRVKGNLRGFIKGILETGLFETELPILNLNFFLKTLTHFGNIVEPNELRFSAFMSSFLSSNKRGFYDVLQEAVDKTTKEFKEKDPTREIPDKIIWSTVRKIEKFLEDKIRPEVAEYIKTNAEDPSQFEEIYAETAKRLGTVCDYIITNYTDNLNLQSSVQTDEGAASPVKAGASSAVGKNISYQMNEQEERLAGYLRGKGITVDHILDRKPKNFRECVGCGFSRGNKKIKFADTERSARLSLFKSGKILITFSEYLPPDCMIIIYPRENNIVPQKEIIVKMDPNAIAGLDLNKFADNLVDALIGSGASSAVAWLTSSQLLKEIDNIRGISYLQVKQAKEQVMELTKTYLRDERNISNEGISQILEYVYPFSEHGFSYEYRLAFKENKITELQRSLTPASSAVEAPGGIDFRAMNIKFEPLGSFVGLDYTLPKVANLEAFNPDEELNNFQRMVKAGIIPSGERIKEFIAACFQRQELGSRADELLLCMIGIFKLQEEECCPATSAHKEALAILDAYRFASLN